MSRFRLVGYVRDPDDGSGVNGVTVTMKLHLDNSTVASDTTDANGRCELVHDTVAYPGPTYVTATSGGTTRVVSGNVWGQLGGLIWPDDVPDAFQSFGLGVIPGIGGELAGTGTGSNRVITIADGAAILKDGVPFVMDASDTVTLSAGDATYGRIDWIVLRQTREGQTEQGKIELTVIEGTPSSSPAAPSLTQTSATWDFPLYTATVAANATTLSTGNLTSNRTWTLGNALTTKGDLIYATTGGKPARLGIGSTDQVLKVTAGVPVWGSVSGGAINATSIGDGSVTNTEFQYINTLSSNAQTQISAKATSASPTFTGNATFQGPIRDSSSGSWTCTTLSSMGSSPGSQSKSGNEYCGRIVQTTGVSGTGIGTLWTIGFVNARSTSEYTVLLASGNNNTAAIMPYVNSTSTTEFTIACAAVPANSQSLRVSWFIVDRA